MIASAPTAADDFNQISLVVPVRGDLPRGSTRNEKHLLLERRMSHWNIVNPVGKRENEDDHQDNDDEPSERG
jgi:hypothetical protein